jgi:nuclease S1
MRRLMTVLRSLIVAFCAAGLSSAHAWGAEGHRLIAEMAQMQLTPAAAAEVDRLLSHEPGATIVSVSTWADEKRSGATASLHYVNLPEGDCNYRRHRDCTDGRCVVEAITAKLAILRSTAPDAERLSALKWVVHLVGDVHQPLHVGLASDKGGNLFQLRAFGRGSNLHAVWDGELIRRRVGGLNSLLQDASHANPIGSRTADPAQWARGSCIVRSTAGFYPDGRTVGWSAKRTRNSGTARC